MASSKASRRADARDALIRLATDEDLPHLVPSVQALFDRYETFYRAHGTALVEARLAQATLVGLRRRTVGLGNGGAVTLELPEVRTVTLGTTVAVPVGR